MTDRCNSCWTFFAELSWYDPEDRSERIDRYLEERMLDVGAEPGDGEDTCIYCGAPIEKPEELT